MDRCINGGVSVQLLKMFMHLAKVEPGQNWVGETLRWSWMESMVPGWALTENWYTEQWMPQKGG